jgi:4a-hydroxytetrahydrobiopterin dehydratase
MTDEKDALNQGEIDKRLAALPTWKQEDKALVRVQTFPQYKDALDFVYAVGLAAEQHNHHPDIVMNFKRVTVRYWTHTARGISALDFRLAAVVEGLIQKHYRPKEASSGSH